MGFKFKGDFMKGSLKDTKFGGPNVAKKIKKIGNLLSEGAHQRVAVGEFGAGVGRDQRDWADKNIRPIERGLSSILQKRLSEGGQQEVKNAAMAGTGAAYDKSMEGAGRTAARLGATIDPELMRTAALDRTKSVIEAGTLAAQNDRDAALNDANRFYRSGSALPGVATQQYIAGAGS